MLLFLRQSFFEATAHCTNPPPHSFVFQHDQEVPNAPPPTLWHWQQTTRISMWTILKIPIAVYCSVRLLILKGRGQRKKNVFVRALPESPKLPPPWPQFGQLGPLFLEVEIQDLKVSLELKILYILYNIHFCAPDDCGHGHMKLPVGRIKWWIETSCRSILYIYIYCYKANIIAADYGPKSTHR